MYAAPTAGPMPPVFLTPHNAGLGVRSAANTAPTSGSIGVANRMIYCPVFINRAVTVYRHFWLNGATASTNNVNVAVYDVNFNRVAIGSSTLSSGANVCQFDNVADYVLGAGQYYLTLWCNGTTATFFRSSGAPNGAGHYYETNASGPQATGTPAAPGTQAFQLPVFGLALRATDP